MALRAKIARESRDAVMNRLRSVVPDIDQQLAAAQRMAAEELAAAIKGRAPVDSGEYRNSIQAVRLAGVDHREKLPGIQTTKDPNAYGIKALYIWRFLEFGSRAHKIRARRKPELVFRATNGALVRTQEVDHPGTTAKPHIFPTYRAMRKKIRRRIATAVNRAIKGMGHNGGPPLTD